MVVVALVAPVLVASALFALQRPLGFDLPSLLAGSPWIYVGLILAVLAAVLAAAWRRRDNVVLLSAWLFLFCGLILVSLGQLTDFYAVQEEAWHSEVLEATAFVPLLIFALYLAAPVRMLLLPRRRRLVFLVLGALIFVAVAAFVLVPWLAAGGTSARPGQVRQLLQAVQPLLDVLLLGPVSVFVISLGWLHGREPYPLVGLGLLFAVPADVLEQYHLLSHRALQGQLALLLVLVSQLYFLGGALMCAACRKRAGGGDEPAGSPPAA
jgi:hypothetical protein